MNVKSLKVLRICALALGWLLVTGVWVGTWSWLNLYYQGQSDPAGFLGSMAARFDILSSLSSFFSGFGNAFFAFLIAAVFYMLEKQAPVGNENARRLMIVCCFSYIADALVRLCSFILNLSDILQLRPAQNFDLRFWIPYLSAVVPLVVPVLYAASIFVLYTHFMKMVMFESEVS